jgi:hypothetical protein
MEERRFIVSLYDIKADFHQLVALVDGTLALFVFNVNELSYQEWADREANPRYRPSDQTGDEVPFPVRESVKRITPVVCLGADGPLLKLLIVIHRKTIDADVALTALPQNFNTAAMERALETHQL